jgi:hypothetical protein
VSSMALHDDNGMKCPHTEGAPLSALEPHSPFLQVLQ